MQRTANKKDFEFVYELYMHPTTNPYLLYEVMDVAAFGAIFRKLIEDNVLYIFEKNDKPVGMFKLVPLTHRSGHVVYLGGFAIDTRYTGKGYGKEMLQSIINLAGNKKFKRIELSVGKENTKAMSLYKSCGFEEEGVLRKYTYLKTEQQYIDEVLMSYITE
jgi:L-phenylalanine/L-methionine N-acetyltransferase